MLGIAHRLQRLHLALELGIIYVTKQENTHTDSSRQADAVSEANKERGVYVPEGMTRHEVLLGMAAVQKELSELFDMDCDRYAASAVARAVIKAIRATY